MAYFPLIFCLTFLISLTAFGENYLKGTKIFIQLPNGKMIEVPRSEWQLIQKEKLRKLKQKGDWSHRQAKAKAKVKSWDDLEKLRAYMHKAFIDALEPRYRAVATRPGPGVARIRIALTNVERSTPFKLGSASMEAELLDSQTYEQIAAIIESQEKGSPLGEYYDWENAKAIMDDWAKRFYNRLEEAHGH